jgi:IS1 family transposase/transposase-like protein
MIVCKYCNSSCIKYGKQKNNQRFKCKGCGKTQQSRYTKKAYNCAGLNIWVAGLVKEGCGIRSMARLLGLAVNTITELIKQVATKIKKPAIILRQAAVEVDELKTYIGRKRNQYWIAYALSRQTGKVVDFIVGKRTKRTLKVLTDALLLAKAGRIYTDNLIIYRTLVPKLIHKSGSRLTNHIERNNLDLRIHLKRLSRRTICFSRSIVMLTACLRIYFWYKG